MSISTTSEFQQQRLKETLRVGIISLGCVRNTVDSEALLSHALRAGHTHADADHADIVIVNTCGFIEAAKKESIEVISDLVALKKQGRVKKIIVAGCLAQRYAEELRQGYPEVDAFVGVLRLPKDARQASAALTQPYFTYLKICESCFNQCSFCAIPGIKGKFTSRSMAAILDDVRRLDARGVKELNIVGQDVTAYGLDLYREKRLAKLLKGISGIVKGIEWLRLLYTYPAHITDELLDVIAAEPVICKYIDMPLQHINDKVLKRMNRNMTRNQTETLIKDIRRRVPGVSLRTTFIVGFPGETDKEFKELLQFIKDYPFERVGAFAYSREEGTKAYAFGDRVSAAAKQSRLAKLMAVQQVVAEDLQERFVGRTLKVLVEDSKTGRSEYDAPDVDGCVHLQRDRPLKPGQFVQARITAAAGYDLEGKVG
ncbi:MAG: MiaB/RimO family radical SAM methylthiotransferase [Candidatus Omnitrophica bacterium]|nr:MiaB/RimO family radical SAM methylthiotransferase [Candidatus Omnitrophota bacterium]